MNEEFLKKSFIKLYEEFLKLGMHIQKNYKSDLHIKKHLTDIIFICEDIAEHYYVEEIQRQRDNDDEKEEPH